MRKEKKKDILEIVEHTIYGMVVVRCLSLSIESWQASLMRHRIFILSLAMTTSARQTERQKHAHFIDTPLSLHSHMMWLFYCVWFSYGIVLSKAFVHYASYFEFITFSTLILLLKLNVASSVTLNIKRWIPTKKSTIHLFFSSFPLCSQNWRILSFSQCHVLSSYVCSFVYVHMVHMNIGRLILPTTKKS